MRPIGAAHGWVAAGVRGKTAQQSQDTTSQAAEIAPVLGRVKMERAYGAGAMFFTTVPPFITNTTRRSAVMSSAGLPSIPIKSASSPGAMAPIVSANASDWAASDVADTIAAIGGWPPTCTR